MIQKLFISFLFLIMFQSQAFAANTTGEAGVLVGYQDLTQISDNSSLFEGSIWIEVHNELQQYFWGGTICPDGGFSDQQIANLAGFLGKEKVHVIPIYQASQLSGKHCLVEFIVTDRKYTEDITP